MPEIEPQPIPTLIQGMSFTQLRQAFQNVGIKVTKRSIQSYDYVAGVSGWKIDSNGNVEFGSGTFRGALVGNTINIPNAVSPLFSVDALGNVLAASLQRQDFHFFSIFESLDGYGKTLDGAGTLTIGTTGMVSTTGSTNGNNNEVQKLSYTPNLYAFSWDKNKASKFSIGYQNPVSNTVAKIGIGDLQAPLTNRHIGFVITNGAVYGSVANGTSETSLNLNTTLSNNVFYLLEFRYVAGSGVNFYIDNTLVGTISTNLPSGKTNSEWIFNWHLQTTTAAAREMWCSFIDLWQAK